jgi:hypothetical protein
MGISSIRHSRHRLCFLPALLGLHSEHPSPGYCPTRQSRLASHEGHDPPLELFCRGLSAYVQSPFDAFLGELLMSLRQCVAATTARRRRLYQPLRKGRSVHRPCTDAQSFSRQPHRIREEKPAERGEGPISLSDGTYGAGVAQRWGDEEPLRKMA